MIDEKGRLFGRINLIDFLVLAAVVLVIAILAIRLLDGTPGGGDTDASATPAPGTSVIEYTVECYQVDPIMYENIKAHFDAGDRQFMTNGGFEVKGSEVIGLRSRPSVASVIGTDGMVHTQINPYYLDISFTIRSQTSNDVLNIVNTQQVRIGRYFIVKTRNYELTGLITACDPAE